MRRLLPIVLLLAAFSSGPVARLDLGKATSPRAISSVTDASSTCNNLSNNRTVSSIGALSPPPPAPTHAQLDAIWSP
jgi:hypothetical protein